ncbi:unnamed protein product [Durusdinium trenchii]|uniref:Uncharacterized protein n=1 Tax=Durusdinium trenchii TaxID=1381693 RepID=A0ABP0SNB0_9DINO
MRDCVSWEVSANVIFERLEVNLSKDCLFDAASMHQSGVAEYQVTEIPEGIRQHPYRRDQLPTLEAPEIRQPRAKKARGFGRGFGDGARCALAGESPRFVGRSAATDHEIGGRLQAQNRSVLLLWSDPLDGTVRGRCLYTVPHPKIPQLDEVDAIFTEIEPYFAKRWLKVQLSLDSPQAGDFATLELETVASLGGAQVTVLACHPRGFASEAGAERAEEGGRGMGTASDAVHVSQCQPLPFQAITDEAGQAQICFLPAALNKVQVAETDLFHGTEAPIGRAVSLMGSELKSLDEGVTTLTVQLLPKARGEDTRCREKVRRKEMAAEGTEEWPPT